VVRYGREQKIHKLWACRPAVSPVSIRPSGVLSPPVNTGFSRFTRVARENAGPFVERFFEQCYNPSWGIHAERSFQDGDPHLTSRGVSEVLKRLPIDRCIENEPKP
jgi:hypothetical protein